MKKLSKKKRIKLYKNSIKNSNTQRGGRFLGKGSFGCVIKPALKCKKTNYKMDNKVSKIIKSTGSNEEKNELYLSRILNKIDPNQNYFLSILDYCQIKSIPHTRSNIASVYPKYSYSSNSNNSNSNSKSTSDKYELLDTKHLDKNFCPIVLDEKPLNIIMQDGGVDLYNLSEYYRNNKNNHSKLIKTDDKYIAIYTFIHDFKNVFKHLLTGLKLMHDNHIVNRDIKEENIMGKYDMHKKKLLVRYIDFGMSEYITPTYANHEYNIKLSGSPDLIAPEIFITYYQFKYKNNQKKIFEYVRHNINKYILNMFVELNIDNHQLITDINTLYKNIEKHMKSNNLRNKYFGTGDRKNSYLQKSDIYSLGIAIYEFIYILTENILQIEKQKLLSDLLLKMICIDPDKRYNVDQCLNHPYFTSNK